MSSSGQRIYLDHNATTPLLPEARAALLRALDCVGNPSSVHAEGREARAIVERARGDVARLVGASPEAVVVTSSATEAAVTCLTPLWMRAGEELTLAALAVIDADHPATREGGRFPADRVTRLPVDANGILVMSALHEWLDALDGRPAMLAVCLANGETGVLQPLGPIREAILQRDVLLVVDVVQAVGRLSLDMASLGADAVLLSGHKLGAAKGIGAVVLRDEHIRPFRLLSGGGQERGLRSGTEAVPMIASFGAAARMAADRAGSDARHFVALRERVVDRLRREGCRFAVIGEGAERLDHTLALSVSGLRAETAQMALDLEGFAISSGSACSSGKVGPSHVLAALVRGGLDVDPALGLLRVSFGAATTADEVDAFAASFAKLVMRRQRSEKSLEAA